MKKNPYFRAFARETWADGGTVGSTINNEENMNNDDRTAKRDKTSVVSNKKIFTPKEIELQKKIAETIKAKENLYREQLKKGKTIVAVPTNKGGYPDSTYYFPNTQYDIQQNFNTRGKPAGLSVVKPYITTVSGVGQKGYNSVDPKDVYINNPNAVIRQDENYYDMLNYAKGGELSKEKAKTMLHDKKTHGKPLTDKQRKYFGWVASGKKSMGGIIGKYANGGTMNRDWEWG